MDPITLLVLAGLGIVALKSRAAVTPAPPPEPVTPAAPGLGDVLSAGALTLATSLVVEALTTPPLPPISETTVSQIVAGISSGITDDLIGPGSRIGFLLGTRKGTFEVAKVANIRLGLPLEWDFTAAAEGAIFPAITLRQATMAEAAAPVSATFGDPLAFLAEQQALIAQRGAENA